TKRNVFLVVKRAKTYLDSGVYLPGCGSRAIACRFGLDRRPGQKFIVRHEGGIDVTRHINLRDHRDKMLSRVFDDLTVIVLGVIATSSPAYLCGSPDLMKPRP